jgi:hypothetical protein
MAGGQDGDVVEYRVGEIRRQAARDQVGGRCGHLCRGPVFQRHHPRDRLGGGSALAGIEAVAERPGEDVVDGAERADCSFRGDGAAGEHQPGAGDQLGQFSAQPAAVPGTPAQPGIQVPGARCAEGLRGKVQRTPAHLPPAGDRHGDQKLGLRRAGWFTSTAAACRRGIGWGDGVQRAARAVVTPGRERLAGQGGSVQAVKIPGDDDRGICGPYLLLVEAGDVVGG